jgi:fatty acid desaturase
MFPYFTPYFFKRYVHLDHHKYLNVAGEDPNLVYADGPFWQMPIRYLRAFSYARRQLEADPRSSNMRLADRAVGAVHLAIWITAVATGHFVDLVLLWVVPFVIAKVIMDWYVNYLPHVGLPAHRYLGTRVVDVAWVTPLLLQHNYHAIHHLWPAIPWHRYLRTFEDKRDFLVERHVPIEHRVFGGRTFPALEGADPT